MLDLIYLYWILFIIYWFMELFNYSLFYEKMEEIIIDL